MSKRLICSKCQMDNHFANALCNQCGESLG